MSFKKLQLRLPATLQGDLIRCCRDNNDVPISTFLDEAITAAAENLDNLWHVYRTKLPRARERKSRTSPGNPMVSSGTSIQEERMAMLVGLVERLRQPRYELSGGSTRIPPLLPPPTLPRVARAVIRMHIDALNGQLAYRTHATDDFIAKPALVKGVPPNILSHIGEHFAFPRSFGEWACMVDSSALLAATVRTSDKNQVEPISPKIARLLSGSKIEAPRVFVHRGDLEEYIYLLWNAVRTERGSSETPPLIEAHEIRSDAEAQAYVIEKVRLLRQSRITVIDTDASAIFEAAGFNVDVPDRFLARVLSVHSIAKERPLAIVSATAAYCPLNTKAFERMGIFVWHPNDIDFTQTGPKRSLEPPRTSHWTQPVFKDTPRALQQGQQDHERAPF